MLVKLIGYETKAFGRIMLPLYAALLALALFTGLSFNFMPSEVLDGLPSVLIFMIYIVLMISIIIMTCVLSVTRFYKNLLGLEGYLMFSLPCSTLGLIASKVLSVLLWTMLSTVVSFLSVGISALSTYGPDIFKSFSDFLNQPQAQQSLPSAALTTLLFILMLIFGATASIVRIYAAIAIGHQFNNHRVLMSVVALIGFNIVGTILTTLLNRADLYFGTFDSMGRIFSAHSSQSLYLAQGGMILFLIGQTALFGLLTWFLLDRKLNLE